MDLLSKRHQWGMPPAGYVDPMKQRNMRMQTPIQQRFDQPPSWGGIKPSDQGKALGLQNISHL